MAAVHLRLTRKGDDQMTRKTVLRDTVPDRPRCRECPLFDPLVRPDGTDVTAQVAENNVPVMRNGVPDLWHHRDGVPVRWGMCFAELPARTHVQGATPATSMREVRSDWGCESPEKHAAIARLRRT